MAGGKGRKSAKRTGKRKPGSWLKKPWVRRNKRILAGALAVTALFVVGFLAGAYFRGGAGEGRLAGGQPPVKEAGPAPEKDSATVAHEKGDPAHHPEKIRLAPVVEPHKANVQAEPSAPKPARRPETIVASLPGRTPEPPKAVRPPESLAIAVPPVSMPGSQPGWAEAAIIIDDIGQSMDAVDRLLAIDAPIALAILPHQAHSRQAAQKVVEAGRVALLHQPMEPKGLEKPGPGVMLATYDTATLLRVFEENLATVPGASGVNNHMGSLLTEKRESMAPLLENIKSRGLFFVDSVTSPDSVAYETARGMGLVSARRDVFLDNERDVGKILEALDLLVAKARKNGSAVGIGHPYPETIRALEIYAARFAAKGVRITPITRLLRPGAVGGRAKACVGEAC